MHLPTWTTPAERQPGWEREFVAVLQRHMALPLGYGTSDCLVEIADVCEAITGRNPLPAALRRYRTEQGAARLLAKLGFADVEAALAQVFPPLPPAMARRGDCGIVIAAGSDGQPVKATVVVLGATVVGKAPRGAFHRPRADLVVAFAVGSI